ncbi:MAG: nickel-responsive transcriptional regulator NikR [Helicobacteraceae bacterium]|jgi:CopG family nickel-responsive transcriptional regulator|nr:nickel-responsive transcriptional regulator NikR [Helicobacteraceae bacterium]
MDETIRFSVSLPKELLDTLDSQIISRGYASRSEFVRDLIREKITQDKWEESREEVIGNLTLVFNHHQRELSAKMIDIQHHSLAQILCSLHVHLDHHNCLESIILKGRADEIESIATAIGGLRGVLFAQLTRASRLDH